MSSIPVNQISSGPKYIMNFIKNNLKKLNEIYNKGIEENKTGMLGFKCSKKENKMDVFFMNEEFICTMMQKDSWENLKNSKDNSKKLFLIHDLDINSIFIITI